jgi:hypothetical protein
MSIHPFAISQGVPHAAFHQARSLKGALALMLLAQACTGKPADTAAAETTATLPALTARSAAMAATWNQEGGAAAAAAAFFADSVIAIIDDSTYSGMAAIRDRWIVPGLPAVSDLTVSDQAFTGSGTSMTEIGTFGETLTLPGQAQAPNTGTYSAEWTNVSGTWMVGRFTVRSDKPAR